METNLLNLVTYFFIYSFLGWVLESIYKTILLKKTVNSGFLFGPFCPIYGVGAIIMCLFLEEVSYSPFVTFCLGFVVLSFWEYIVGALLEKVFHTKYWDYSNKKFNLQGRVCLINSIFWGILGVMFIDIIHPFIQEEITKVNQNIILYIDIILMITIIIDVAVSIKIGLSIPDKLRSVEELNERIKEKIEEIKLKGKEIEFKNESVQLVLEELKQRRNKIIRRSYRYINRLKKAFPTMKSEQISKLLNQKIEFFRKEK